MMDKTAAVVFDVVVVVVASYIFLKSSAYLDKGYVCQVKL